MLTTTAWWWAAAGAAAAMCVWGGAASGIRAAAERRKCAPELVNSAIFKGQSCLSGPCRDKEHMQPALFLDGTAWWWAAAGAAGVAVMCVCVGGGGEGRLLLPAGRSPYAPELVNSVVFKWQRGLSVVLVWRRALP